jgi:uncharacterized OB-fold protein
METRFWKRDNSLLALEDISHVPYRWALGPDGSAFFHAIKEREVLLGIRCPGCGTVYVPPRQVCGPCFVKMDELVQLGNAGTVKAVTLVNYPFIDPDTGQRRPVPYVYGYIQLDGADNLFSHIVKSPHGEMVKVGDRVRVVFAAVKHGNIQDISHFEPVAVSDGDKNAIK